MEQHSILRLHRQMSVVHIQHGETTEGGKPKIGVVASNSSQYVELLLQESCTDDSGSLVVYLVVDVEAVKLTCELLSICNFCR
ncbi:START domain, Homeodomain-like, START-like domain protein [Artemisia annua]|uniref:START domain, Homeodomain-like, START-like domain protein n=1 Tax=Artemisia annua TaxID=35608 RepID=A0A2U1KWC0_ARTAN|nr:START domain, Homeodomain-like, START-like domain protein [Artemisia annua]